METISKLSLKLISEAIEKNTAKLEPNFTKLDNKLSDNIENISEGFAKQFRPFEIKVDCKVENLDSKVGANRTDNKIQIKCTINVILQL